MLPTVHTEDTALCRRFPRFRFGCTPGQLLPRLPEPNPAAAHRSSDQAWGSRFLLKQMHRRGKERGSKAFNKPSGKRTWEWAHTYFCPQSVPNACGCSQLPTDPCLPPLSFPVAAGCLIPETPFQAKVLTFCICFPLPLLEKAECQRSSRRKSRKNNAKFIWGSKSAVSATLLIFPFFCACILCKVAHKAHNSYKGYKHTATLQLNPLPYILSICNKFTGHHWKCYHWSPI